MTRRFSLKNLPELINAARNTHKSNSCIEGVKRKFKQIERTAYGYRNFKNLTARIKLEEPNMAIKEKVLSYPIS
ncbi:hypothetical protein DS833_03255 [Lactobacillus bombicola]|nr:hypothetical protein DS833_03255 [Lactobacillus bombicola]